jgi:hypothetical protein
VVKTKLARIVEEKEQNDPAKLHRRIHELERSLRQMEGRVGPAETVEVEKEVIREIPVFEPGQFEEIEKLEMRLVETGREFWSKVEAFQETLNTAGVAAMHPNNRGREMAPVKSARSPGKGLALPSRETSPKPAPAPKQSSAKNRESSPNEGVSAPQQRVLNALQWWHKAGVEAPNRHMLAFAAKFKVGGYFTDLVSSMKTADLVSYPSPGVVTLTGKGQALCDPSTEVPTRRRLIEMTLETIKKEPQRKIFRACVEAWPSDLNREELAERAGFKVGGYFTDLVSSVKTAGLIEYPSPGRVKLAALFNTLR